MKIRISGLIPRLFSLKNDSGSNADMLKDMGILDHIEKIVKISQKNGIDKCLIKGKTHIAYVSQKLGITPVQAALFSHVMEKSADKYNNSINDIARSIKCTTVRIIKYLNEFDELEKKKLVRCKREDGGISFLVPDYVRDSLRKSNEYMPLKKENLTIQKIFAVLKRLFRERENDELTFSGLLQRLSDLVSSNMHLPFCRKLRGYNLNNDVGFIKNNLCQKISAIGHGPLGISGLFHLKITEVEITGKRRQKYLMKIDTEVL